MTKEWNIFTSEPSVGNYLLVKHLEKVPKPKRTFKQKILEQLGLAEYCYLGHKKTVKGGYYGERLHCWECNL